MYPVGIAPRAVAAGISANATRRPGTAGACVVSLYGAQERRAGPGVSALTGGFPASAAERAGMESLLLLIPSLAGCLAIRWVLSDL